ncbi:hypothetical protein [Actinomadura opuntiae]|uniref:hypothetical protein n=1 Tax=Actinomadura sp. OS1-43 TaxID=604315 RepID=UPI00255AC535|nr:hypothetical protein [Actinomadura sp. OS1-43]MDL4815585.1 hypothetical protein [Actinomadura sp. OS1-43]
MDEFVDTALGFPTALFSFSLVVVAAYWTLVLLGGLGHFHAGTDGHTGAGAGAGGHVHGGGHFHGGGHAGGHEGVGFHDGGHGAAHGDGASHEDGHGSGGPLAAIGLGGVPATITLSLLIALAWFASLAGSVLVGGGTPAPPLALAVLAAALAAAWLGTRLAVVPLRRVFREEPAASLRDFVGRTCVVRTGRVGVDFGQAEVTADDGSSAIVQVRRHVMDVPPGGAGVPALAAGSTALIFDFDPDGQFFWVTPYDGPAL